MKSATRFLFKDARVKAVKPELKTRTYSDQKLPNLKLVVTPNNTKTYYVRFKLNGHPENYLLGDANSIGVDDARARAVEYINFKRTPTTTRGTNHNIGLTLNDVFALYKNIELKHRKTVAGRTHSLEVAYNKHIKPEIGKLPVDNITKSLAKSFFAKLERKGYGVHNKALSAVKAALNYVIDFEDELNITANPFLRLKKMQGVSRNRYLSHDEARSLLTALTKVNNQDIADVYRIALFTGARLSNIKSMRWSDVNLSGAVWLIPATATKTKQNYEIPLHSYVLNILRKRKEESTTSDFVFFSRTSKYGYMTGGDPVWKEAIKLADLYHENPNIRPRPHDLRRTFATWQIQSGADISVVSKALCHTSLKHTLVYAHTNVNQVRQAIDGAFSFLN